MPIFEDPPGPSRSPSDNGGSDPGALSGNGGSIHEASSSDGVARGGAGISFDTTIRDQIAVIGRVLRELRELSAGTLQANNTNPFLPRSSAHRHVEVMHNKSVTVTRPDYAGRLVTAKVRNYELPLFDPRDLVTWSGEFSRWLRMNGQIHSDSMSKMDGIIGSFRDKRTQKRLPGAAEQENIRTSKIY